MREQHRVATGEARRGFGEKAVMRRAVAGLQRRHRAGDAKAVERGGRAGRAGDVAELGLHPADARRECRQHAEPLARRERRLEHRLVRLQHRHMSLRGGLLDRLAKGRAGEEDAGSAVVLGVFGEQ
jgi:hypothetical protein